MRSEYALKETECSQLASQLAKVEKRLSETHTNYLASVLQSTRIRESASTALAAAEVRYPPPGCARYFASPNS
eukprot:1191823-Prorocentrum_minimum.AAC.3